MHCNCTLRQPERAHITFGVYMCDIYLPNCNVELQVDLISMKSLAIPESQGVCCVHNLVVGTHTTGRSKLLFCFVLFVVHMILQKRINVLYFMSAHNDSVGQGCLQRNIAVGDIQKISGMGMVFFNVVKSQIEEIYRVM